MNSTDPASLHSPFADHYGPFHIRSWQPTDRDIAARLIGSVLTEYGLGWEPEGADRDVYEIESTYWQRGGEFWVVTANNELVGTAGYYPIERGQQAVEIRKMYLLPQVRGQGLGRYLLQRLEQVIGQQGYLEIWIETASVLQAAVKLYEAAGYRPATGVETRRCDRVYVKSITAGLSSL